MTAAIRQAVGSNFTGGGSDFPASTITGVLAGSTLIFIAGGNSGTDYSTASDGTNAFTLLQENVGGLSLFARVNVAAGSYTVTAGPGISNNPSSCLLEISGVSASPLDGSALVNQGAPGTGVDAITAGPPSPNNAHTPALVIGITNDNSYGADGPASAGTGYTFFGSVPGNQPQPFFSIESLLLSSGVSAAVTFTAGGLGVEGYTTAVVILDQAATPGASGASVIYPDVTSAPSFAPWQQQATASAPKVTPASPPQKLYPDSTSAPSLPPAAQQFFAAGNPPVSPAPPVYPFATGAPSLSPWQQLFFMAPSGSPTSPGAAYYPPGTSAPSLPPWQQQATAAAPTIVKADVPKVYYPNTTGAPSLPPPEQMFWVVGLAPPSPKPLPLVFYPDTTGAPSIRIVDQQAVAAAPTVTPASPPQKLYPDSTSAPSLPPWEQQATAAAPTVTPQQPPQRLYPDVTSAPFLPLADQLSWAMGPAPPPPKPLPLVFYPDGTFAPSLQATEQQAFAAAPTVTPASPPQRLYPDALSAPSLPLWGQQFFTQAPTVVPASPPQKLYPDTLSAPSLALPSQVFFVAPPQVVVPPQPPQKLYPDSTSAPFLAPFEQMFVSAAAPQVPPPNPPQKLYPDSTFAPSLPPQQQMFWTVGLLPPFRSPPPIVIYPDTTSAPSLQPQEQQATVAPSRITPPNPPQKLYPDEVTKFTYRVTDQQFFAAAPKVFAPGPPEVIYPDATSAPSLPPQEQQFLATGPTGPAPLPPVPPPPPLISGFNDILPYDQTLGTDGFAPRQTAVEVYELAAADEDEGDAEKDAEETPETLQGVLGEILFPEASSGHADLPPIAGELDAPPPPAALGPLDGPASTPLDKNATIQTAAQELITALRTAVQAVPPTGPPSPPALTIDAPAEAPRTFSAPSTAIVPVSSAPTVRRAPTWIEWVFTAAILTFGGWVVWHMLWPPKPDAKKPNRRNRKSSARGKPRRRR